MPRETAEGLMQIVGSRVAELREARGWTQEELAELLDCTPKWIQTIERGQGNVSLRALAQLGSAFGVAVVELFSAPARSRPRRPGRPRRT